MTAHILAVDDSRRVRTLFDIMLSDAGHRVTLAEDDQNAPDFLEDFESDAAMRGKP